MNVTKGKTAKRAMASKRGEEDDGGPEDGERSATCEMLDPHNGSKPMAPVGLPNVPPVSDTSNLARSTIRHVILVNASFS